MAEIRLFFSPREGSRRGGACRISREAAREDERVSSRSNEKSRAQRSSPREIVSGFYLPLLLDRSNYGSKQDRIEVRIEYFQAKNLRRNKQSKQARELGGGRPTKRVHVETLLRTILDRETGQGKKKSRDSRDNWKRLQKNRRPACLGTGNSEAVEIRLG